MNTERLELLAQTIEAERPEVAFDMRYGIDYGLRAEDLRMLGRVNCRAVCCVAGTALLLAHGWRPGADPLPIISQQASEAGEVPWPIVGRAALQWLELPATDDVMLHDLFCPAQAPCGCTPAEAAQAIRNVAATGDPQWAAIAAARTA